MAAAGGLAWIILLAGGCQPRPSADDARAPTFSRDLAPLLHRSCAPCHRPGGAGPFALLTYRDARSRARQIATVTRRRYMPPWLPEPGEPGFVGDRRLTDAEIALIERWVAAGAPEGNSPAPPPPRFAAGWQLGEPDLVLEAAEPFMVPAEGADVFRNLVLPVPLSTMRYVRAVELAPGNPRVVHHAIMALDRTPASRRRDALDPGPGYGGMDVGDAEPPDGHFLGWTPGRVAQDATDTAWRLGPGSDFVVQLHLVPSGKPEPVRPRVGFFFTDRPPARTPSILMLANPTIDIPPGATDHAVEDVLTLPVAVQLLGLYPHAHYLGKEIRATAQLPDGTVKTLLHIARWNFSWQEEYRYREPVPLPAGTRVAMRYTFDNSAANPRNPSTPPRRVVHGPRAVDEMATLLLQVQAASDAEAASLAEVEARHHAALEPENPRWHGALGHALLRRGQAAEAAASFRRALALDPQYAEAIYGLGRAAQLEGRTPLAERHYRQVLAYAPLHARAHTNLGKLLLDRGASGEAREHLTRALAIQPDLASAHFNLALLAAAAAGGFDEAVAHYRRVIALEPADALAHSNLGSLMHTHGRREEAIALYRAALAVEPDLAEAHNNLGLALAELGRTAEAIEHYRAALAARPDFALARRNLGLALAAERAQ